MSERFKPLGQYVYEKGERIGCSVEEAAVELSRKLNAYQMRVERLKAEVERLREAGDELWYCLRHTKRLTPADVQEAVEDWIAAKEGRPNE